MNTLRHTAEPEQVTQADYERSADKLALLSGFVVGSRAGHGFMDQKGELVHVVYTDSREPLPLEQITNGEAAAQLDGVDGVYVGRITEAMASKLYAEHYAQHSDLRTAVSN